MEGLLLRDLTFRRECHFHKRYAVHHCKPCWTTYVARFLNLNARRTARIVFSTPNVQ